MVVSHPTPNNEQNNQLTKIEGKYNDINFLYLISCWVQFGYVCFSQMLQKWTQDLGLSSIFSLKDCGLQTNSALNYNIIICCRNKIFVNFMNNDNK